MTARVLVAAVAVWLANWPGVAGAAQEPTLEEVLGRAAEYVTAYQRDFGSLIADEHYMQSVDGGRSRRMESELLVFSPPEDGRWLVFRDVITVDGKPVPDRDQGLADLFRETPVVPAALELKLRAASARYNIGFITRDLNLPTMVLHLLTAEDQPRLAFEWAGEVQLDGIDTWEVAYRAVEPPALIRDAQGQDLLAHGSVWIEPSTGRIVQTALRVEDDAIGLTIEMDVRYAPIPDLGILVPVTMTERYAVDLKVLPSQSTDRGPTVSERRPSQRQFLTQTRMTIECEAVYSNFRSFVVEVNFATSPSRR